MPHAPAHPEFLVIGAQKCGTSWLHRHLAAHPDLWLPPGKELEFFSYTRHLDNPGLDAYRRHFEPAGSRLAGEATASYFWTLDDSPWCVPPAGFEPDIPATVLRCLGPEITLVVSLRDPVERALSAWAHYLAHGELDPALPFREAARYGGIVHMGFYGRHLERWRRHFAADRIHLLIMERDLLARPAETLVDLYRCLGVDNISFSDETLETPVFPGPQRRDDGAGGRIVTLPNDAGDVRVSADDLRWLRSLYEEDAALLERWAGPDFSYPWPAGD